MKLATEKGVVLIQILGDSMLIIDWINSKNNQQNMTLSNQERIRVKRKISQKLLFNIYIGN